MDYKKAYNEALQLARSYYDKGTNEFLDTIFPELKESEDEGIRKEINTLYADIDSCISELLAARTNKDSEAEGKALFRMEGLMVATLQDLSCIEDWLEKQKEQKPEPNIELIEKSWYREGYLDGKYNKEPLWVLENLQYKENPKYGQDLESPVQYLRKL